MRVFEVVEAFGHLNVRAKNRTTFEVTKDDHLTRRGDCIIAVSATKGARDLNEEFKQLARAGEAKISVVLEVGEIRETVVGRGDPKLTLSHASDLVVRKSYYVCDRTLMVGADKAATDLSRELVKEAQNPSRKIKVIITVEV